VFKISHKGKKKIPSKASGDIDNTSDDTESDDEISILTNKIKRLLRKKESKRKEIRFKTKDGKEQDERIICYGCKKPGRFKLECLIRLKKKRRKKRRRNSPKRKRVLCQPGGIWIHPVLILKKRQT